MYLYSSNPYCSIYRGRQRERKRNRDRERETEAEERIVTMSQALIYACYSN